MSDHRTIRPSRVIVELIRQQPRRYGASLLLWVAIWTMPIIVGLVVARYFDALTGSRTATGLTAVVAAIVVYALARVSVIWSAMRLHANVLFRAGAGIQRRMMRWIYRLPGARPVTESGGEVVSRFRDDVNHIVEALDFTVDLVGAAVSGIAALVILWRIDTTMTLVVVAPGVAVIVIASRTGTIVRRYRKAARDATEAITGFLGETLGSVQAIKVAGVETQMLEHFDALNETRKHMMVRDRTLTEGLHAVFRNTVNLGTGLILVLAAGTLATPDGLTVGEFSLFVFLLTRITDSAYFIGRYIAQLKQAGVSMERVVDLLPGARWQDLMGAPIEALEDPDPPVVPHRDAPELARLEVRGLSYRYPGTRARIEGIDLEIHAGEFVVVTGRIGSGKTTLLRTLLGLLPADAGTITWNGEPIDDPATFMVPPRTAYTPQVPRLFSMTLRDNLVLGEHRTDAEIRDAIAAAILDRDLADMPDGLDTMVGPRGVRLSGGQVQRAAAARMFLRHPQLLVFDDLSSALDVETEAALWDRLFDQGSNATALVVSNRRAALERADRVVVLAEGKVAAAGTATELRTHPEFRRLWFGDETA